MTDKEPTANEISLRDWIAVKVLQGILSSGRIEIKRPEDFAESSYEFADAMIRYRAFEKMEDAMLKEQE